MIVTAMLLLGLMLCCVLPARAEIAFRSAAASGILPGSTTTTGCTSRILFADSASHLNCSASYGLDSAGAGDGQLQLIKTPSGASANSNFLTVFGTMPVTMSAATYGVYSNITGAGSSSQVNAASMVDYFAGYTGTGSSYAFRALQRNAGTGAIYTNFDANTNGSNDGLFGRSLATTTGSNVGAKGYASGGNENVGGVFMATTTKNAATNIGLVVQGLNLGTTPGEVGIYVGMAAFGTDPTLINSTLQINNNVEAVPILIAQDNSAALPTTGATAIWQITDGAWPQVGNGVLTSATMTAETQARECGGGLCHSYTWTNAMVAALSGTAGDITVATLPAKTMVSNAYVVITGAAVGPATVTVSCGDAIGATPFINWIVASDAKAAANTVYGDATAERGTSIDTEFFYLPSYTATTLVTCHFISTGANLSTVTGSTGRVIIQTSLLP